MVENVKRDTKDGNTAVNQGRTTFGKEGASSKWKR